jgi:hypothetical protein
MQSVLKNLTFLHPTDHSFYKVFPAILAGLQQKLGECLDSPKSDKFLYIFVKMCICSIPVKAFTLLT